MWLPVLDHKVNRHTGGLENKSGYILVSYEVNRHTGGLEIIECRFRISTIVNRHTGGLENLYSMRARVGFR